MNQVAEVPQVDAMIAFFSRMRLVYDGKKIPDMARECDEAIALIQRIILDPRLDGDNSGAH